MHALKQQAMGSNTAKGLPNFTQFVGAGLSGYDATFGPGESKQVSTFIVARQDILVFVAGVLGYSYADPSQSGKLFRSLPMQNPEFPFLYATQVSGIKPLGWDRTTAIPAPVPAAGKQGDASIPGTAAAQGFPGIPSTPTVAGVQPGASGTPAIPGTPTTPQMGGTLGTPATIAFGQGLNDPKNPAYPPLIYPPSALQAANGATFTRDTSYGPFTPYLYYKVTVAFATLPYDVLPDSKITVGDDVLGEQQRFLERRPVGAVEILQMQNGQFSWEQTSGLSPAKGSVNFKPGMKIGKVRWRFTWKDVPDNGLFDSGGSFQGGASKNLDKALGNVNSKTIFGKKPGALLFESYELTPRIMPIDPLFISNLTGGKQSATNAVRSWDVLLNMIYYDPNTAGYTKAGYPYYGHNLFPNPNDRLFYQIQNPESDATATIYSSFDFASIFLMVNS